MFEIRKIPLFIKRFSKIIPLNKQNDVNNRIRKLQYNPFIGAPLGYKYLRELKIDKFRVYYVIFETEIIVMLITVSDKKDQQETIDYIKTHLQEFKDFIKNLNKK